MKISPLTRKGKKLANITDLPPIPAEAELEEAMP